MNIQFFKKRQYKLFLKQKKQFIDEQYFWEYGNEHKSHYAVKTSKVDNNELIGCVNLIHLFIFNDYEVYFLDSIEIKEKYRRKGIGSQLLKFCIDSIENSKRKFLIFGIVVNCSKNRLNFFSRFKFQIIDKRINIRGNHCILTYPVVNESRGISKKIFEFFKWQEENIKDISSDCKFAAHQNSVGLYWCEKKEIFISGLEKQYCKNYIKDSVNLSKKKVL